MTTIKFLLGAFLLAFTVGNVAAEECNTECPGGWEPFGEYCYKLTAEAKRYAPSKADCEALGAHMSAPHSQEELEFVKSIYHYVWVACDDIENEGDMVCCDGTPSDFQSWRPGEPNDLAANGGEDCATINGEAYNDINCGTHDVRSVCKRHISTF